MNTSNSYKHYCEKCKSMELIPITKRQYTAIFWTLEDLRKTEKFTLDLVQDMCEESLPPETFESWEKVKVTLLCNRKQLNNAPNCMEGKKQPTFEHWLLYNFENLTCGTFIDMNNGVIYADIDVVERKYNSIFKTNN